MHLFKVKLSWASVFKEAKSTSKKFLKTHQIAIEGKEILRTTLKTIDISKLSNGIYFITIETNNSYVTQKFIKN